MSVETHPSQVSYRAGFKAFREGLNELQAKTRSSEFEDQDAFMDGYRDQAHQA